MSHVADGQNESLAVILKRRNTDLEDGEKGKASGSQGFTFSDLKDKSSGITGSDTTGLALTPAPAATTMTDEVPGHG